MPDVEDQVDDDRNQNAAACRNNRKQRLTDVGKLADGHFVFNLEADDQEEDSHEDIVNDMRRT